MKLNILDISAIVIKFTLLLGLICFIVIAFGPGFPDTYLKIVEKFDEKLQSFNAIKKDLKKKGNLWSNAVKKFFNKKP